MGTTQLVSHPLSDGEGREYAFPWAAITTYHRLGGFKQQKDILSQF